MPSIVTMNPCTIPVGLQVSCSSDPLVMFSHFIHDDFLIVIVRETNMFATQQHCVGDQYQWDQSKPSFHDPNGNQQLTRDHGVLGKWWEVHNSFIASCISCDRYSSNYTFWTIVLILQGRSLGITRCRRFSQSSLQWWNVFFGLIATPPTE